VCLLLLTAGCANDDAVEEVSSSSPNAGVPAEPDPVVDPVNPFIGTGGQAYGAGSLFP
jgi:hypothetical protein